MQVHLLGIGNVGKLIAHGLAKSPSPPEITLLFHRNGLFAEWKTHSESIEVVTRGTSDFSTGYQVETIPTNEATLCRSGKGSTITNLIVSTKTTKTVAAVRQIQHRLTRESTILLAQNGMGVIDELNRSVFPDAANRPQYAGAVVMHGIYTKHTFGSIHAGTNTMTAGKSFEGNTSPKESPESSPAAVSLLEALAAAPILGTKLVSPGELLAQQFEKLVINGSMSALSSILDCKYGDLFHSASESNNKRNWEVAQRTIQEMSRVILAILEDQTGKTNVQFQKTRFSAATLEALVLRTAKSVAESYSSMVEDVRAKRETEIDYINGYILRKAGEIGLDCPINKRLVELVKCSRDAESLYGLLE